jgi:hypothetical protein
MKHKHSLLCLLLAAAADHAAAAPAHALRDPFARPAPLVAAPVAPAVVEAPEPPPRLRALILNGTHSVANVDGEIVAVGEQAGPYTVVRIDAAGVLVTRAGKQQLLLLDEKDKQ